MCLQDTPPQVTATQANGRNKRIDKAKSETNLFLPQNSRRFLLQITSFKVQQRDHVEGELAVDSEPYTSYPLRTFQTPIFDTAHTRRRL